jgi:hypothetical protein
MKTRNITLTDCEVTHIKNALEAFYNDNAHGWCTECDDIADKLGFKTDVEASVKILPIKLCSSRKPCNARIKRLLKRPLCCRYGWCEYAVAKLEARSK